MLLIDNIVVYSRTMPVVVPVVTHVRARDGAVRSLSAVVALILAVSLITLEVVR
jgi:hypothetical protein